MSVVSPQQKFLFDQNLASNPVDGLREVFPDTSHVTAVDLDAATDHEGV